MYYDINKTLSHNCLFNFIVGMRGVGKTYSFKKRAIKNFLKSRKQFVYLRRYDTEIKKDKMEKFFDDIMHEFPEVEFTVKHGCFYIDGMQAGFYLPLSKAAQYKSVPYPNVELICFDEFIIDQGLIRYLPREVQTFNEMYSTIARTRDVTAFFMSNAITFVNPYFLYFDLNLKPGQKLLKKNDMLVEVVENPEFVEMASRTRFGKIIAGTEYGDYAINNQAMRDNDNFVTKMPGASTCILVLRVDGCNYGVYSSIDSDNLFVSESYDPTCGRVLALDTTSHTLDTSLTREGGASLLFERLKQKYYRAEVRFTSIKVKNIILSAIKET